VTNWFWLLAPDGSYATVDHTLSRATRKRKRGCESSAAARQGRAASRRRLRPGADSVPKQPTFDDNGECGKQGKWYWLLAEDGSPSTVYTTPSASVRRKQQEIERNPDRYTDEYNEDDNDTASNDEYHEECINESNEDDSFTTDDEGGNYNRLSTSQVQKWKEMYDRLVAHKKMYKTTCVPHKWKEDLQLGYWVHTQRDKCEDKRWIDLLNDIGFVWNVADSFWTEMYKRLVAFKKRYKTTCVPEG
jgi:hypothetical protein